MAEKTRMGFALCGSFCTLGTVIGELERLALEFDIYPIVSLNAALISSRFGDPLSFINRVEKACGREVISRLADAEPIGPGRMLDVLVVAPATGNTIAKIAAGLADTPVTLAVKSHLRNQRPVVLGISTNAGLSGNARNIGLLLARKHFYFVPDGQDDPYNKPCSLIADFSKIGDTARAALEGRQLQPVLYCKKEKDCKQ
jgi:dipicolinate synthase subunit B